LSVVRATISLGRGDAVIEHETSGGADGQDSRRERRVRVDLPASVGARSPRAARVVDASLVGCLLRCEADLDAGAVVDLQLELPDGPVRTKARVAQSSLDGQSLPGPARYLAGLEFLGLAAADEPRLRAFLESESRRSAGAGKATS
jgi:hypothetical protein